MTVTKLNINGKQYDVDVPADTPLLWVLRDELGLTGTKFGCGMALCGACTIHIDGQPGRACVTPISALAGKKVVTIEAIGADKVGKAVQTAWINMGVPQCGYCQAGQIMSATALLKQKPKPTDADIDAAMTGNICRCGTYGRIRAAIKQAAGEKGAIA
jgi:isoquinoline 1-oxidoreductase alpha subunit